MADIIWTLIPWMSFIFATRFTNLWGGLAVGGLVALVALARGVACHRVHIINVASVTYFAGLAAVLAVVHPGDLGTWARYAPIGSHALVTLLVVGSVLIGRPFTESYAREKNPEAVWDTPGFRASNRDACLALTVALLVGTISLGLAGAVHHAQFILQMVVPSAALASALQYTKTRIHGTTEESSPLSAEPGPNPSHLPAGLHGPAGCAPMRSEMGVSTRLQTCSFWSLLQKRNHTLPDQFSTSAGCEGPRRSREKWRAGERTAQGWTPFARNEPHSRSAASEGQFAGHAAGVQGSAGGSSGDVTGSIFSARACFRRDTRAVICLRKKIMAMTTTTTGTPIHPARSRAMKATVRLP
jgi:hypothetical protein